MVDTTLTSTNVTSTPAWFGPISYEDEMRKPPLNKIITIPTIIINTSTISDVSRIDWDQEVDLDGKKVKLNSDEVLNNFRIDPEIRSLIKMYRSDVDVTNKKNLFILSEKINKLQHSKEALHHLIAQKLVAQHNLPKDYFDLESRGLIIIPDNFTNLSKKTKNRLDLKSGKAVAQNNYEPLVQNVDTVTVAPTSSLSGGLQKIALGGFETYSMQSQSSPVVLDYNSGSPGNCGTGQYSMRVSGIPSQYYLTQVDSFGAGGSYSVTITADGKYYSSTDSCGAGAWCAHDFSTYNIPANKVTLITISGDGQSTVSSANLGSANGYLIWNGSCGSHDPKMQVWGNESRYRGIPPFANSSTEKAFNYLITKQKSNGSWGNTSTSFIETTAVLDAFNSIGVNATTTDQGIEWLDYSITDNNDFFAQKTKLQAFAGEPTTTAEILAGYVDEVTGGFAYNSGYQTDPATTADALMALTQSQYTDSGSTPDLTDAYAIYYLTQSQRFDGGWSSVEGGDSSIPVTVKAIEALLPYKDYTLWCGTPQSIDIETYLNKAITWLKNIQLQNGTWSSNLVDNALAYYILEKAGVNPTFENEAISYLTNSQAEDGSFANGNIYVTAAVLKALSMPPAMSGHLAVTDIIPLSTLQTGVSTSLKILVHNSGKNTVSNGILYLIADGYVLNTVDFVANNISIGASSTAEIIIPITNTYGLVGDVDFIVSLEGSNGTIHDGSRYKETLTFAADATGLPGLPTYFVAQKFSYNNTTPAVNVRWKQKDDPNRLNYMIMWRQFGTSTWTWAAVSSTQNGAWITPLIEDQKYEVTVGAMAQDGTRYTYYSDPAQVIVSGNQYEYATSTLSGVVNYAGQPLSNVYLLGYIEAAGPSGVGGIYSLSNVPYGRGAVGVLDFRYDQYMISYVNSGGNISNFKIPTNLKFDTENPTVTDVSIFGEGDMVVPNKKDVTIQYSVNDDEKLNDIGYVQSATFSYYDPHDQIWHSIGTQDGPLYQTMTYNWHIPDNLLGTDYQLQVVVRDYSGKQTTSTPWGPFEIVPGNSPPTFSFIAPSTLVPSEADLKYTIRWNAKDDEDNPDIYLYKDVDQDLSGHNGLIGIFKTNDILQQYEWDTSAISKGSFYIRAVVCDGVNTCTMVYSNNKVTINHFPPSAPTDIQINGLSNPSEITSTPKFSAIYNDPSGSSDLATHYRIQVGYSPAFTSLKWDSLKTHLTNSTTPGSRIEEVEYSGPPFGVSTTYYWRIKLWDKGGDEGAWSSTGNFTSSISTSSSCLFDQFSDSGGGLWLNKKPIQITGSNQGTQTGYVVPVTIDTASLVGAGKMQINLGDLRFSNSTGNELPWWVESGVNSAATKIWVKVDSIPSGGTTIYMHYGNLDAMSGGGYANNGSNTFDFFDNFEDQSFDGNLWGPGQRYGLPSENSGLMAFYVYSTYDGGQEIQTVPTFSGSKIAEFNMTMDMVPGNQYWKSLFFAARIGSSSTVFNSPWAVKSSGWWSNGVQDCAAVNGGPYLGSVAVDNNLGQFTFKLNTTTCGVASFTTTTDPYVFNFADQVGDGWGTVNFRDFRVRSFVSSTPTAGSAGAEELENDSCVGGGLSYPDGGSWHYKRPIEISGSTSTLVAYSVPVIADAASLISMGKMQSNLADLRFVDSQDKELPWWVESEANTSSAKIWVKINSIPPGGTTIYMYYGNPSARLAGSYANNGKNAFEFFDDFSDSIIDGTLWGYGQNVGLPTEGDGNLYFHAYSAYYDGKDVQTIPTFSGNRIAEFNMTMDNYIQHPEWKSSMFNARIGEASSVDVSPFASLSSGWWSNGVQACEPVNGGPYLGSVNVNADSGTYTLKLGSTTCGSTSFSATTSPYVLSFSVHVGTGATETVNFYDLRVRPIVYPEPVVGALGEEEIINAPPSQPSGLLVNNSSNPTKVTSTPIFSAIYNDPDTDDASDKYRIQVSTSSLFSSTSWDSGTSTMASTTRGNRIQDIIYSGAPLSSSTVYYWRIKFWDSVNNEGVWSANTSTFVLSLMINPSESRNLQTLGLMRSDNVIYDNSFEDGSTNYWKFWSGNGGTNTVDCTVSFTGNCSQKIIVSSAGNVWDSQFWQDLRVDTGINYTVKFRAKATTTSTITFGVNQDHSPWSDFGLAAGVSITPDWKQYAFTFTSNGTDELARVFYYVGTNINSYWLEDVEVTPDNLSLIKNPSFETSMNNWYFWSQNGDPQATNSVDCSEGSDGNCSNKTIVNYSGQHYQVQLSQNLIANTSTTYLLKFDAKSSVSTTETVVLTQNHDPYADLTWSDFSVNPSWQSYSFEVNPSQGDSNARVTFYLGRIAHTFQVDNVSLVPKQIITITSTPEFSAIYESLDASSTANSYQIQLIQSGGSFTSPFWDSGRQTFSENTPAGSRIPNIVYGGSGLQNGTKYYWRIKLWDNDDNEGQWTNGKDYFETIPPNRAPVAPTALWTENQTNPANLMVSLPKFSAIYNDLDLSDTANKYRVQVSTSSIFSNIKWDSGTTTMATTTSGTRVPDITYGGSTLASSIVYYWRISLVDVGGLPGAWSAETSTFSLNSAPAAPTDMLVEGQTNPTNIATTTPRFSAIYNDPDAGDQANRHRLQVSTSSVFASIKWDSGTTTMVTTTEGNRSPDILYTGSALATNIIYYWRVEFVDVGGLVGAWSTATSTFSLNTAPTVPTSTLTQGLVNPSNLTSTPKFSAIYTDLNSGDQANKYRIQVSTSSSFTVIKWDSGTTTMATTTENSRSPEITYAGSALVSSTIYYWRIAFEDVGGLAGGWSTTTSTFSLAGSPSYIQSQKAHGSKSVAFSGSVVGSNLVVVGITAYNVTFPTSTITDNKGNTYYKAAEAVKNSYRAAIFYAKNVIGGSGFTVSSTVTGTLAVHEYAGINTTNPLDKTMSGTGSSVTPSSGNITTTSTNELYFGLAWSAGNNNSWTAGSGYTIRQTELVNGVSTYQRLASEDRVIAIATTTAAKFTTSASNAWAAIIATFKSQ
jgi:hypothetical protein